MEQPKKLRKLTKQEVKFTEKVIETGNLTKAVQESFNIEDPNYAGVKGHRLIRNDKIIEAIEVKRKTLREALYEKGINEVKVAETINELLDAKDEKGLSDYTAKDKGLKHALSIYGVEDPEKPKSQNTYNFIFNAEAQSEIKAMEEKIKAKLINPDA